MRVSRLLPLAVAACVVVPSVLAGESAPALTAEAGRVCQQKFTETEEPGPLEPPALVVRASEKSKEWSYEAMLPARSAGAPKTVFCVRSRFEKEGTYSDRSTGYSVHWTVTALSWPEGRVRRKDTLISSPPASKASSTYPQDQYGSVSASDLEAWLKVPDSDLLLGSFIGSAFLSPDRRTLAVAVGVEKDRGAQLFDWPSRAPRARVGKSWPHGFLPDGRLMTGAKDGVALWDASSGRTAGTLTVSGFPMVLSRDATRVITRGGTYQRADFWELPSGRQLASTDSSVVQVWNETAAMSTDGRRICAVVNGKVALWDPSEGRAAVTFDVKANRSLAGCAVSGDGKWLALSQWGGAQDPGLYRLAAGDGSVQRLGDSVGAGCLGLSSDGRWLAVGQPRELRLWDLTLGKEVLRRPAPAVDNCESVFSPDDTLLWQRERYVGAKGNTLLWDAKRLIDHTMPGPR